MRVALTFDPLEEREAFDDALNGSDWRWTLQKLDEWLKGQIKHVDREELQDVRDELRAILPSHLSI